MRLRFILFCVFFSFAAHAFPADIEHVCFTPGQNCTCVIVSEIDQAKERILVQAYSFTSMPIAKALLKAHQKGIKVAVILDKSQTKANGKYSSYTFLKNNGIPVYIDSAHAIAHNKIMIIDQDTVITGSFNFTKAAEEKNAENIVVIHAQKIAGQYIKNWFAHREHSY